MTLISPSVFRRRSRLKVVLFSGGRGSAAFSEQLIHHPSIDLTLAINGYDDGASTGEVRRFLGDSLGPSDFRKNASRLARALSTAPGELIDLLDTRLPAPCNVHEARHRINSVRGPTGVVERLAAFMEEFDRLVRPFEFSDCSLGNLVFAGSFLRQRRDFNRAVADYCALLHLPAGLIANITDGTDAHLVALDVDGLLLASEEDLVDARRHNRVADIYLIDRPIEAAEAQRLTTLEPAERRAILEQRQVTPHVNPAMVESVLAADLIIYAPGTQHSSLFPSYLTPGLGQAIARNLGAIKLLITNLRQDAEITGASAVDIINRALFYLREKGRTAIPAPALITHYLLNEPGQELSVPYVPLGAVEALGDPRLIRIGHYEDGVSGHHDAEKLLAPFVTSLLGVNREPSVAIYLHDADSPDKLVETLLEMVRGGAADLALNLTVIHCGAPIDAGVAASLPCAVRCVKPGEVLEVLRRSGFEYVILFESSGMYRGEDIVGLGSQLVFVRLDAVWGSRRLSSRDVEESLALRYRDNWPLLMASRLGSHALSALYLLLFGRYISDTLSGVRAVRTKYLNSLTVEPAHKLANHQLLAALLRDRSEVIEIPVGFFPISPRRVKRTSILDGCRAALEIIARRLWNAR
jgi:2-phospho-L-lactate transferase/gluconeogenesis factor (CofD/UPF0052 family)